MQWLEATDKTLHSYVILNSAGEKNSNKKPLFVRQSSLTQGLTLLVHPLHQSRNKDHMISAPLEDGLGPSSRHPEQYQRAERG